MYLMFEFDIGELFWMSGGFSLTLPLMPRSWFWSELELEQGKSEPTSICALAAFSYESRGCLHPSLKWRGQDF